MSEIHFACLHCGKHLAIDLQAAGMSVRCPDCNGIVTVPRETSPGRDAQEKAAPVSGDAVELSNALKKLKKENSVLRSELHVSEDRRKKIDFDLTDLRARLDELNRVYAAANRRVQERQAEIESLKLTHAEAEHQWAEEKKKWDGQPDRTAFETLEQAARETAAERDALQQRLDEVHTEQQPVAAELESLRQAHEATCRKLEVVQRELASRDPDDPAAHAARVHELEQHLSASEARCEDLTSEVRRARDEINALRERLTSRTPGPGRPAGIPAGIREPSRAGPRESMASIRDKMLRKTKPGIEPEAGPSPGPEPGPGKPVRPPSGRRTAPAPGPESHPDPFMHIPQGGGRGFKVAGFLVIILLGGYLAYTYLGSGQQGNFFGLEQKNLFPDISVPLANGKMKTVQLGESVLVDGVQIEFFRARIDRVTKRSFAGTPGVSEKSYLVLDFKMRNAPNNIPVYANRLWKETDLHIKTGGKIRQAFPKSKLGLEQVEGDIDNAIIEPGKTLEGSLVFERPPDRALEFTLVSNPGFYRRLQDRSGPSRDEQLGIPRTPDTDEGYAPVSDRLFAIEFSRRDIHETPVESADPPARDTPASGKDQTAASAAAR